MRPAGLPGLRLIVTVPGGSEPRRPGPVTLRALELGPRQDLDAELAARTAAATAQDIATIFCTSGTTGLPKGVAGQLPLTVSGKVQKSKLAERAAGELTP